MCAFLSPTSPSNVVVMPCTTTKTGENKDRLVKQGYKSGAETSHAQPISLSRGLPNHVSFIQGPEGWEVEGKRTS